VSILHHTKTVSATVSIMHQAKIVTTESIMHHCLSKCGS
jgi:hypothetical protein